MVLSGFGLIREIRWLRAASALVIAVVMAACTRAQRDEIPPLLGPPPSVSADAQRSAAPPAVKRSRLASLPAAAALGDTSLAREAVREFRADLFDDVSLVIQVRREAAAGVWAGTVTTGPGGDVTIASTANTTLAEIRLNDGRLFRIRPLADGLHSVEELDQSRFPPELQPRRDPDSPSPDARGASPDPAAAPTEITVLVAYTEAAKVLAGGDEAIRKQIDMAETLANTGYANSKVKQTIRVVHRMEVTYNDTLGFSKALDDLTGTADGQLDNLHTLRDTHKADQVSLWIANTAACGLAWLMKTPSAGFASKAFSVVYQDCATSNFSFAHELGHNQGVTHDKANTDGPGSFAFCFGLQVTSATPAYRTIMAYPCTTSCPRQNFWSNPSVSFGGKPSGTADANNAACLELTRTTVGAWRQ